MVSCGSCATLDLRGQKPKRSKSQNRSSPKERQKRPDRKEDLATPSRKRSLGQLGNLSRSVARASQEPRAGHWALAGQDAQRSQQPGKPQRELPAHPLAATMGSGPKSRGAIHGAMRSGGGGRCGRW